MMKRYRIAIISNDKIVVIYGVVAVSVKEALNLVYDDLRKGASTLHFNEISVEVRTTQGYVEIARLLK